MVHCYGEIKRCWRLVFRCTWRIRGNWAVGGSGEGKRKHTGCLPKLSGGRIEGPKIRSLGVMHVLHGCGPGPIRTTSGAGSRQRRPGRVRKIQNGELLSSAHLVLPRGRGARVKNRPFGALHRGQTKTNIRWRRSLKRVRRHVKEMTRDQRHAHRARDADCIAAIAPTVFPPASTPGV